MEQRQVLARFRFREETIYTDERQEGTLFTPSMGTFLCCSCVYIENVPAWVCKHCGEQYFDAPVYKQMEKIAQQREQIQRVISFPLAEFEMATL